jgi:hypothetical protein
MADLDIAGLNIAHFRKRLATETDETSRKTILQLLAQEEAKLAAVDERSAKEREC